MRLSVRSVVCWTRGKKGNGELRIVSPWSWWLNNRRRSSSIGIMAGKLEGVRLNTVDIDVFFAKHTQSEKLSGNIFRPYCTESPQTLGGPPALPYSR